MINLSREELKLVSKHIDTITTIIRNHSCSFISQTFRDDIRTIADNHKLDYCLTCNSGIFNICANLYSAYTIQSKKKDKNNSNEEK